MTTSRLGRPPKVSRELILATASTFSPDELQVTALADALGVSAKTIRYYFPNRAALVHALTERTVSLVGRPDLRASSDARAALLELGRWVRGITADQPAWYFDVAAPRALGIEVLDEALDVLMEAGLDEQTALHVYDLVTTYSAAAGAAAARAREAGGTTAANVENRVAAFGTPKQAERVARLFGGVDLEAFFQQSLELLLDSVLPASPLRGSTRSHGRQQGSR